MADEDRHLDELTFVEVCGEHRPGAISDPRVGVKLVDGTEHCGLQIGPSFRLRPALHPRVGAAVMWTLVMITGKRSATRRDSVTSAEWRALPARGKR
ncbi:MAG TPA: hypothetical protein VKC35_04905 [Vicinamibacterales bacterium]|nr:hypothetical protein [Vicinamibacterales bacterium]